MTSLKIRGRITCILDLCQFHTLDCRKKICTSPNTICFPHHKNDVKKKLIKLKLKSYNLSLILHNDG